MARSDDSPGKLVCAHLARVPLWRKKATVATFSVQTSMFLADNRHVPAASHYRWIDAIVRQWEAADIIMTWRGRNPNPTYEQESLLNRLGG